MKILFITRHYSYLRLFDSAIVALAERGHELVLAATRDEQMGGRAMVERIATRFPNVTLARAPERTSGAWAMVAPGVRLALDYLRYLHPRYVDTPHLRQRSRVRTPRLVVWLAESPAARLVGGVPGIACVLRWLERGLPADPDVERFIAGHAPDLVLLTPLVTLGSSQLDQFAVARRLGVRTVFPVASWDHLSCKALLRSYPDRVIVWNEQQRIEATELHGVPPDRVVVTGAHSFDHWFGRAPSRTRELFCADVGLRPGRQFVLYVCSCLFRGTVSEPAFVDQWIRAIRSSGDPRVRDVGILIRPHPARLDEWKEVDLTAYRDVVFWGAHPIDEQARADYFDSLHYSAAVVGLNTSAFLEAACVGKQVLTVLLPEISPTNQEGTLHFRYLLSIGGGLLRASRSLDAHVVDLAEAVTGGAASDTKSARFVEAFIRPFGRDVPGTPRLVEAIETAGAAPLPVPEHLGVSAHLAHAMLWPIAASIAVRLRIEPGVRRMRKRIRKGMERRRMQALRAVKQFVSRHIGKTVAPAAAASDSTLTPKAGRLRDPAKRLAGSDLPVAVETRALVELLGRSGRPIILGPWLSETGFELLYWIPFLTWAKEHGQFDPDRLVVISRGGAAPWYRHLTPHYEDIFSFYTPDEFRVSNERRIEEQEGRLKHVSVSAFDREIIDRVIARRGLRAAELLHPSVMYALFDPFWFQRAPMSLVEAFTTFAPIPAFEGTGVRDRLPAQYVAAKFYGNSALPDSPTSRAFVARYLATLARDTDVVLLNTPQRFDDHEDFPPEAMGRIHRIDHLLDPVRNLAIQTDVIRNASGFVGTYGGFSYLAPLCGVDTLAFYSHASGFRFDHLDVAKRVFSALRCGTFTEVDLRAVDLLRLGLGNPGSTRDVSVGAVR